MQPLSEEEFEAKYTVHVGTAPNGTDWWCTPEAAQDPALIEHYRNDIIPALTRPPEARGQDLMEAWASQVCRDMAEEWQKQQAERYAPSDPPSPFDW
jgi:hypothetical protein